jgi:hypothetical protein
LSSPASVLLPVPEAALYGTSKAEVLSRAKVAVEAGARPHEIAEILACARKDFRASQREMGRAIGRSATTVNRLLKWRRSGFKTGSPFGPSTRAGRTAHRTGSAKQPEDDGTSGSVEHDAHQYQTPALPALNENLPRASAQTEVLPGGETANGKIEGIEEDAAPVEIGGRQPDEEKLSAERANSRRKRTPERMKTVIEALRRNPYLGAAAAKAGIHLKTLSYWLKCSKAGHVGYDIDWEGHQWKFHEACDVARDEAYQIVEDALLEHAIGPITYKNDPDLVDLGMEGIDAYARDENGDFIVESRGPGNVKIQRRVLEILRPERWAKTRKRKTTISGGVLVMGGRPIPPKTNCAASIRTRQWKCASRMLEEVKH